MGDISFQIKRHAPVSPQGLWAGLVNGNICGWPMLEECKRLEIGAPLRFRLRTPDGKNILAVGRIVSIHDGESLTIAQESPWQGRVKLQLSPAETGSDIRLTVSLSGSSVSWLLDEPAPAAVEPRPPTSSRLSLLNVRIGLLVPLSGQAGVLGRSIANAVTLSVEELNQAGGFGRRQAELYIEDDRSSPVHGRRGFERLADVLGCDVVIANVSSVTMQAVAPLVSAHRALVLNTAFSERQSSARNFLHFGESPTDQLWESIPEMMRSEGTKNWFILGNDYVWPRTVGMVANELILRHQGEIAGESYMELGSQKFDSILDRIAESGADVVLSSLVGVDSVKFEQKFFERGYRNQFRTLAVNFDDTIADHVGRRESAGIWTVQDYFMPTLADEMNGIARRYHERFGELAPNLTSMGKAAYDAVQLYAQAAHIARSYDPVAVADVFRSGRVGGQRLHKRIHGDLAPTSTALTTPNGFEYLREH